MSLDDIIKTNRGGRGAGGRGGIRGRRGSMRLNNNIRPGSRSLNRKPVAAGGTGGIAKRRSGSGGLPLRKPVRVPDGKWVHDLYGGQGVAMRSSGRLTASTSAGGPGKITISNLDFGVNDKDIQDLFEEFGAIKKAAVHYDRTGRSLGTADVVFEKKQDALRAVKKYNGVQLDGREMNIQITESVAAVVAARPISANTSFSPRRGGLSRGGLRRGTFSGRGRGGARRGANKPAKTQAELDADLDTYTSKMQTD